MKFTKNISCLSLLLIGVKEVLSKDSSIKAEVLVYGTPAEEGGGGKVKMIEHNVFDEVDICMMSHPAPLEIPIPVWLSREQVSFVFHGWYFCSFCMF